MADEEQRIILSLRDEANWGDPDGLKAKLLEPALELAWRNQIECKPETLPLLGAALLRCTTSPDQAGALFAQLREDARFAEIRAMWDFALRESPHKEVALEKCKLSPVRRKQGEPNGAGVGIAMINSDKVDSARFEDGRVRNQQIVTTSESAVEVKEAAGHATRVAAVLGGTSGGFATGSFIHAYRARGAWDMARAIDDMLINNAIRVICAPMEATDTNPNDKVDETHILAQAISVARAHGRTFFASAGDSADAVMVPPASLDGVISIGGLKDNLKPISPLMAGGKPDFWIDCGPFQTRLLGSLGCLDGTSVAVPLVAGAVATWYEKYPDLCPDEVVAMLASISSDFVLEHASSIVKRIPIDALAAVPSRPTKIAHRPSSGYADKLVKATKGYLDKVRESTLRD